MTNQKLTAQQRAEELIEKMCQWEDKKIENNFLSVRSDNPYLPEFNACMEAINS